MLITPHVLHEEVRIQSIKEKAAFLTCENPTPITWLELLCHRAEAQVMQSQMNKHTIPITLEFANPVN